ncbi:MarR family winged helix-turn-helix transcriptional regulator [Methylobacterium planeticum]|uniref:MarR family transcriptional regulator n=1 Tax=Methylobacterium planeticum TaxID=2615211 RepID=A0A6N6MKX7_9HYPH|nr:MarR family transcriptional regulator [Methylobacterium planeticum]KAB1069567.1 MarR family transcriptional regulator [Methylobacterium planeticum]
MESDLSQCSNAVLRQAMRRLGQLYDEALAPSGLRATQHALLSTIDALGAPTMGLLAERLVMDLSGLGHTLKPLARDGLIARLPDTRDRRARRVTLTELGRTKLAETTRLWRGAQDRFESVFGTERAADLRAVLRLLVSQEFHDAFAAGIPLTGQAG